MELRKLEQEEHRLTRNLWERVFPEDTKEFLDYYYYFKSRENEIFVIEEEGAIRSMLQLNPYQLRVESNRYLCHYIIAVATEEKYRGRGYMGKLLRCSLQEMYGKKEPFTFLMPAAAAIYTPYDFRFIYDQTQAEMEVCTKETDAEEPKTGFFEFRIPDAEEPETAFFEARLSDAEEMAAFVQKNFAGGWQVSAVRSPEYYQTLLFEQKSENGGIRLLRREGRLVGMFCHADEDGLEIREPFCLKEAKDALWKEIRRMAEEKGGAVKLFAWECAGDESSLSRGKRLSVRREPVIMARILHLESLLSAMRIKPGEELSCSFAVLDAVLPQNSRIWKIWGGGETKGRIQVRETEDSEGALPIGALTGLLFGYQTVEQVLQEEGVIMTDRLAGEMKKLQVLRAVWLNEVV